MINEEFIAVTISVSSSDGYYSPIDNKAIPWSFIDKCVYSYMVNRNKFFVSTLGNKHYESQSTIADVWGLERKAVGRSLSRFLASGVIKGDKLRPGGKGPWKWVYHSVKPEIATWKYIDGQIQPIKRIALQTPPSTHQTIYVNTIDNSMPEWAR